MATLTVVLPQTDASANNVVLTDQFEETLLHATGLAGAEEVDVYVMGGPTRTLLYLNGALVKLTATASAVVLPSGPTYSIDKDASVGAAGVYISYRPCR